MIIETGTATYISQQATAQNQLLSKSYQMNKNVSNSKELLGELLLYLQSPSNQKQERNVWGLFEIMLIQYIEMEY